MTAKGKKSTPSQPSKEKKTEMAEAQAERPKHPLENTWSFWFFTNKSKKNWLENLVELAAFDTVEDYWCLYNHTKTPSELHPGQDYAVFKKGVSPMWEDAANNKGGRWFLNMEKRASDLDRVWLDVVLLMIGENFGDSNANICGAVVNVRGKNKISVWTRSTDESVNMVIGKTIKDQLRLNFRLQFYKHNSNSVMYVV